MSYHPTLGRFVQRDPLGYVDGGSLYEYVRSGPVGAVDPAGLGWEIVMRDIGGAIPPHMLPLPPEVVGRIGNVDPKQPHEPVVEPGPVMVADSFEYGPYECGECEDRLPVRMVEFWKIPVGGLKATPKPPRAAPPHMPVPPGPATPPGNPPMTVSPVAGTPVLTQIKTYYECIARPHADRPSVTKSVLKAQSALMML